MEQFEKDRYLTKSTLKARGWSEELIREFLPSPKKCRNPHYSRMNMYLWKEKDVIEAEKIRNSSTILKNGKCIRNVRRLPSGRKMKR